MYTEEIERIQRFKLALRMGIPIFMLAGVLLFSLLTQYFEHIPSNFIIIIVGLLAIAVYFQFFLIYQGFKERITDTITHTFTREYFLKLFSIRSKKKPQTLLLYRIDNLSDINERLGYQNGDRILYYTALNIDTFFQEKGIKKPIIAHFKGGDFLVMFDGIVDDNRTLFDLFCAKLANAVIENIELKSSGAIIDTTTTGKFEHLVERLFELQIESQRRQIFIEDDKTDLNALEHDVIEALEAKRLSIMGQRVEGSTLKLIDVGFKLIDNNGKLIHQKRYMPILSRLGRLEAYAFLKLDQLITHATQHPEFTFTMSLSSELIRKKSFTDEMRQRLMQKRISNIAIILEEKEYFPNIRRFDTVIQSFRALGVIFILDGLGSNHTTMLYMKDLRVDMVRFESSFGKKISDERYRALIDGFNSAAHQLGVQTWMRLLEEEEAVLWARKIGIDAMSGNFFGTIASIETLAKE